MANLKATTVTSGQVSEKIGTTPVDSEDDYTDNLGGGFGTERPYNDIEDPSSSLQTQRVIQYDPHNARRFVVVYTMDTSPRTGRARIGIIKGTEITYSNEYVFGTTDTWDVIFAWDPSVANKLVITYRTNYHRAKVGTISVLSSDPTGFQVTFGAEQNVGSNYTNKTKLHDIAFDPNVPGRFCITSHYIWGSVLDAGVVICGDVASSGSGTTISWGADLEYNGTATSVRKARIAYDPNTANRLVVVWQRGASTGFTTGTYGLIRALDVSSVTLAISAPQGITVFYTGDIEDPCVAWDKKNTGKFTVLFTEDDDGDKGGILFGTCNSDGTFTAAVGVWRDVSTKFSSVVYDPHYEVSGKGRVIISFQADDESDKGKARMLTLTYSGYSILIHNEAIFNAEVTTPTMISADYKLPGRFIIGFSDVVGGYDHGKVVTGKSHGGRVTIDLATGSFFTLDLQTVDTTIDNFVTSNVGTGVTTFDLRVIQGSSARYFDWGSINNIWSSGPNFIWASEPSAISATDNAVDVYSFTTYDNGTTWYGSIVGQDIK